MDDDGAENISIEAILAAGLSRGLTFRDTDLFTVGMWVDYIIEYNRINSHSNNEGTHSRRATQADFNNF